MSYVFRNGTFHVEMGSWHDGVMVDRPVATFDVEFPWQYDDRDREWSKIPTPVLDTFLVDFKHQQQFLILTLIGRGFLYEKEPILTIPKETMGLLVGSSRTGRHVFLEALERVYPPGALEHYWRGSNTEKQAENKLKIAVRQRNQQINGLLFHLTSPFCDVSGLNAELPWIVVKSVKAYHHFTREMLHGRNPT